jgi:hypothetical protein
VSQSSLNLTLPTFLIGPEARGRGYGLLAQHGAMAETEDHIWAADLAMMLAAWADIGEADLIACLPIRSGTSRVLIRARFAGRAELGSVAFLHGVVLGPDDLAVLGHQPERVIGSIPAPGGGTDFGDALLTVQYLDPVPTVTLPDLSLAWHHRLIVSDGSLDPQTLLCTALATITPESQRLNFGGWISSAKLPARGTLDPARDCALVIADELPEYWRGTHIAARLIAGKLISDELEPPPVYRAWCALTEAVGDRIAPSLHWQAEWRNASADQVVAEQLRLLTSKLDLAAMTGLLCLLANSQEPAHADAARRVIGEYFSASRAGKQESNLLQSLRDQRPADIGTFLAAAAAAGAKLESGAIAEETLVPLFSGVLKANVFSSSENSVIARFVSPLVVQAWHVLRRRQAADSPLLGELLVSIVLAWPRQYLARDLDFLASRAFFTFIIANRPDLVTRLSRDLLHVAGTALAGRPDRCRTTQAGASHVPQLGQAMADNDQIQREDPGEPAARIILPTRGLTVAEAGPEAERPQPAQKPQGADQTDEDVLALLKAQGDSFSIAMLGFRTSGKTWLLNRIKRELALPPYGLSCEPSYAAVTNRQQKAIALGRSDKIEKHVVLDDPPFTIIDVHGELVQELANGNLAGARMLVAVLQRADAVIITAPCDALLFGHLIRAAGQGTDDLSELIDDSFKIDQLNASLVQLGGLVSLVRSGKIKADQAESYRKFTPAMVQEHLLSGAFAPIGGADGFHCPAFCALTKADRVLGLLDTPALAERPNQRLFDALQSRPEGKALASFLGNEGIQQDVEAALPEPSMLVEKLSPEFYSKLTRTFPLLRFDFVSAFFGHDQGDDIEDGHYDRYPELGVTQILEWLRDVRDLKDGRLHGAAALAAARKARGRLGGSSSARSFRLQRIRGQ